MGIEVCEVCGVPSQFINSHTWTGGGTIVERNDPDHCMVLIECDNLDSLFNEVEALIGTPIERIVIEAKRRATRDYLNRIIPTEVIEMVQRLELDLVPLIEAVNVTGHILGYGDSRLVKVEYANSQDDYVMEAIKEPYSVPLWCGDLAGSSEAITSRDYEVRYEMIGKDELEIKAWPSARPVGLTSRLQPKEYAYIDDDMELEKCSGCGGPAALRDYVWSTERGVIEMRSTVRRVAMLGPLYLNAIFEELEKELGEDIPRVVVEAQRRFTKQGIHSADEIGDEHQFRKLLALRGLGNLVEMKMNGKGLRVSIENSAIPLMLSGLMQGYYEVMTGVVSNVDWEVSENGTLVLVITSRG